MRPGTIVRCRNRDWVLLPSDDDVYLLRPLAGGTDEVVAIHKSLSDQIGYTLPDERIRPSTFPLPTLEDLSDAAGAHLLWQAARLTLREGAAPLRSLGRISIRPRAYQFVPLLMALRIDPVRLFIADDVGVGKTIEALLIARELWDRREIRRLCVLCPPYLCDQWQKELTEKFNLEAAVIRSGTISSLEAKIPAGKTIYNYFPIQVISIDWVKSERNRHQFLQFCPELVIVDEVHGAAEAYAQAHGKSTSQQERHRLLRDVAKDPNRHLILLTATPHSGIQEAFRSLLGLLNPEFSKWDLANLDEAKLRHLAKHFVQRTRKDIEHVWENQKCFPERESVDECYKLSERYRKLFDQTYRFCSEIVQTGEGLKDYKRRVRYWGALALLRCVMSSPDAAIAALEKRAGLDQPSESEQEEQENYRPFVFESTDDRTDDEIPTPPIEATDATLVESDRRKLRELAKLAKEIKESGEDQKLNRCIEIVRGLLEDGFNPIVWCRYVPTVKYVAKALEEALKDIEDVQVVGITGEIGEDQRRALIDEIDAQKPRVLVATDCLSEGINLQDKFTGVVHYDLPWNPNRLEQREGRVDRYGQTAKVVKAVRFYGRDNPIDGVVIDVLLNKAREIHRALGTYVPVPGESESVTEALLQALFMRKSRGDVEQLILIEDESVQTFHRKWDEDAEREKISRTRFAQRALKPDEVRKELEETDKVLGDPDAVREFVLTACQRLGIQIIPDRKNSNVFRINLSQSALSNLPDPIRDSIPSRKQSSRQQQAFWNISFISPTPEGAEYIGRNHRFVSALASYLLEEALTKKASATASRCGVIRTRSVDVLTTLLLLRVRYLVELPNRPPLLSEEVLATGYQGSAKSKLNWLCDADALKLLSSAKPDQNVSMNEKREIVDFTLKEIGTLDDFDKPDHSNPIKSGIAERILERAKALEQSHKRIRQAVEMKVRGLRVKPQFPPDLIGILILQPAVKA